MAYPSSAYSVHRDLVLPCRASSEPAFLRVPPPTTRLAMTRHAPLPLALLTLLLSFALRARPCAAYDFLRDYSGISFFDSWDFYNGWDNLTGGTCPVLLL
jgi:hypothetical protein